MFHSVVPLCIRYGLNWQIILSRSRSSRCVFLTFMATVINHGAGVQQSPPKRLLQVSLQSAKPRPSSQRISASARVSAVLRKVQSNWSVHPCVVVAVVDVVVVVVEVGGAVVVVGVVVVASAHFPTHKLAAPGFHINPKRGNGWMTLLQIPDMQSMPASCGAHGAPPGAFARQHPTPSPVRDVGAQYWSNMYGFLSDIRAFLYEWTTVFVVTHKLNLCADFWACGIYTNLHRLPRLSQSLTPNDLDGINDSSKI